MGRLKKRTEPNPEKVMNELMRTVCEIFEETGELKQTAEEIGMSPLKVRKILVTAGVYENELAEEVNRLFAEGKTPVQIQEITGLGRSSLNGYLPYTKVPYKMSEVSLNAKRITMYRKRQVSLKRLQELMTEECLWDTVVLFQNYRFMTLKGLAFYYKLKVGRNGQYNRELLISRQNCKPVVWSSVRLAFEKAIERQGEVIERPKALGDIRGISYIYPMFFRFGIIEVPEKMAEKMRFKGGR